MYTIKSCSDVSDSISHQAFSDGFADYSVNLNMDQETFVSKLFGPEGNSRELSFVALKNNVSVGITLGGLKTGEGIKTLRCGGMAIIPSERGSGLAQQLMEYHQAAAINNKCKQLFLEVIASNKRAVSFYQNLGYQKVYDLTYRKWEPSNYINKPDYHSQKVETLSYQELYSLREMDYSHLPWQADFFYFQHLPASYYGIREKGVVVAGIAATASRIFYLWVHPKYRLKGYARSLLNRVIADLKPDTLSTSYANNASAHTFCNYLHMDYHSITQYEMYKLLSN